MDLIKYLIEEVDWQNSLVFLVLSGGPTLFWLLLCLKFDRAAPEPRLQILRIFLWGCLITLPIIFLAGYLTRFVEDVLYLYPVLVILILSFLVDGLIEESAKYLILRWQIYESSHFDELRDGFVYGMTLGLGLAFVENILYGFLSGDLMAGASTILMRGFTSTFMHFLSGGIIGYHLGLIKFSSVKNPKLIIWRGLILAILFHGLYNTIVRFGWWWDIIPLAVLLIGVYLVIFRKFKRLSKLGLQVPKA